MSLDSFKTGDKPNPSLKGEGRWEEIGQQPASPQGSGGVGVDSTSGRAPKINWETSGKGSVQASAQAAEASQTDEVAGGVGVPLSSVNLLYLSHRQAVGLLEELAAGVICGEAFFMEELYVEE